VLHPIVVELGGTSLI